MILHFSEYRVSTFEQVDDVATLTYSLFGSCLKDFHPPPNNVYLCSVVFESPCHHETDAWKCQLGIALVK